MTPDTFSAEVPDPVVLSLGAGIQSSALALMASHGVITPMPDCGIFADTGDEPAEVYEWLEELCRMLSFPIIQLKMERLSDMIVNEWGHSQIPAWFMGKDGPVIGRRQCSKYWKILPVRREIRSRYQNQAVTLWLGISTDEVSRAKDSGVKWLTHSFPLLDHRLSRRECESYLAKHTKRKVPKSACVYCPYRGPNQWRQSLSNPEHLAVIRKVEAAINPRGEFLTKHLKPLEQIDFSTEEDRGQVNLFNNLCEAHCGV